VPEIMSKTLKGPEDISETRYNWIVIKQASRYDETSQKVLTKDINLKTKGLTL